MCPGWYEMCVLVGMRRVPGWYEMCVLVGMRRVSWLVRDVCPGLYETCAWLV